MNRKIYRIIIAAEFGLMILLSFFVKCNANFLMEIETLVIHYGFPFSYRELSSSYDLQWTRFITDEYTAETPWYWAISLNVGLFAVAGLLAVWYFDKNRGLKAMNYILPVFGGLFVLLMLANVLGPWGNVPVLVTCLDIACILMAAILFVKYLSRLDGVEFWIMLLSAINIFLISLFSFKKEIIFMGDNECSYFSGFPFQVIFNTPQAYDVEIVSVWFIGNIVLLGGIYFLLYFFRRFGPKLLLPVLILSTAVTTTCAVLPNEWWRLNTFLSLVPLILIAILIITYGVNYAKSRKNSS